MFRLALVVTGVSHGGLEKNGLSEDRPKSERMNSEVICKLAFYRNHNLEIKNKALHKIPVTFINLNFA